VRQAVRLAIAQSCGASSVRFAERRDSFRLPIRARCHRPRRSKIDAAIADALGIEDDLSMLRKLLAAEPIISMRLPA
jgi:hypothetical protein